MKDIALKRSIETVVQRAFPSLTIRDLSIKEGSNNGDNYMGVMHAIDVQLENKDGVVEQKHLILKASPVNEARKEFAEDMQVFDKEAAFYRQMIPELLKFQKEKCSGKLIQPAFVECYDTLSATEINNRKCDGSENCIHCQPELPWHYILMKDIRAEGGFRMANRFTGLDFDHCELVITELAKYHALGYAYIKSLSCKTELLKKLPFLEESMITAKNYAKLKELFSSGWDAGLKILARTFPEDSNEFKKLKRFIEGVVEIYSHFVFGSSDLDLLEMLANPVDLSNPNAVSRERKERNQWLTIAHGDCWVNNFLFQYSGEKPVAVKLVDLQLVREICLTTDIAYFLYMSTTTELRRKHLNQLLGIYYETFRNTCTTLNVEPWADFTLENLKKKFQKATLFGASLGLSFLPIVLLPKEEACDLEKESKEGNLFGSINMHAKNENLENRILATAKECFAQGLFN